VLHGTVGTSRLLEHLQQMLQKGSRLKTVKFNYLEPFFHSSSTLNFFF